MRPYSPGGVLNTLATALQGSIPAAHSTHRLRRGLPGYLILFATHAFASQRQYRSRSSPSPRVFLLISTNFTSTPGIPRPSPVFEPRSLARTSQVKPGDFTCNLRRPPARPLRPVIPNNAYTPRIAAAAGTELAGVFFEGTVTPQRCCRYGRSSPQTELYNPKAFITHAAWLRQGFPHCARFPTAASRRSLDRVSVPVWLIILSDQLPIVDLVSHYLTNNLMGRELIPKRTDPKVPALFPQTRLVRGLIRY